MRTSRRSNKRIGSLLTFSDNGPSEHARVSVCALRCSLPWVRSSIVVARSIGHIVFLVHSFESAINCLDALDWISDEMLANVANPMHLTVKRQDSIGSAPRDLA